MPGEALLRLAEVAPVIVAALFIGAFLLFALGMQPVGKGEGRTIVIVDDDTDVRRALRRLIEDRTVHRVVGEASDGAEGLAVIESLTPDAVVIDVKLPVVDGIEATQRIKERHPYIKVIGFSSADDDATGAILRRAGASKTLVKGDSPDEIVDALIEVV
ncbi:MAG: response regulator [Actinomycetota bacterium]